MRFGVFCSVMLIVGVVAVISPIGEKCRRERYILLECRIVKTTLRSAEKSLNLTIRADAAQLMPENYNFSLKFDQTHLHFTAKRIRSQSPQIALVNHSYYRFPVLIRLLPKQLSIYAEGKRIWSGRVVFESDEKWDLIAKLELAVPLPFSGVWIELGNSGNVKDEVMTTMEKFGISMLVAVIIVLTITGSIAYSTYQYCTSEDTEEDTPPRRTPKKAERERLKPLLSSGELFRSYYCTAFPQEPGFDYVSETAMLPSSEPIPTPTTARSRSARTAVIPTQPSSNSSATTYESIRKPPSVAREMTAVDSSADETLQPTGTTTNGTTTTGTKTTPNTRRSASTTESKRPASK